jgi:hypothetical protein
MDANGDSRSKLQGIAHGASTRFERCCANRFEWLDANSDGAVARGEVAGAADRFGYAVGDGNRAPMRDEIAGGMRQGG